MSFQTFLVVTTFPVVKGLTAHRGPTLLLLHFLPPLNRPSPSSCCRDAARLCWGRPSDPSYLVSLLSLLLPLEQRFFTLAAKSIAWGGLLLPDAQGPPPVILINGTLGGGGQRLCLGGA